MRLKYKHLTLKEMFKFSNMLLLYLYFLNKSIFHIIYNLFLVQKILTTKFYWYNLKIKF